ncbi:MULTISPECIES: bifunctional adenosylcobinamide kinase/adenosylcobinamide-phosphate guanylyltransferase [unclassified Photobacterium]|uniref:bifunctional adenosylcobinamide kinase/adenosylcobinamide-phosphate guanylyltransferase n=1 Tax=unclassified Photobacterium TaxID=2628852 RepID=UPI001EDD1168|nr:MULTISPECIES: bifunctional adenosylcobinamide kinase/adenosylcobinamide-phosphate guanylyltransferase [unclassified Photobacterium]MCG3864767.1 bifunctional adenosylcobinamide kinase/adenosylcobinamide-phosphate guanylyltransferase [Photobacterium sp. Ph6]MCG3876176.1 bifunctional adenosylcobinamide kinase/adenosylcobinamide-phosphate guanylyltransferase [Photobacterium sp. Ph5]
MYEYPFEGTELILGGARSGKSCLAEQLAEQSGLIVKYIATATTCDSEMAERIQRHQQQRPSQWMLIEEPYDLATVIREHGNNQTCLLIDCLTLWLNNCLFQPIGHYSWEDAKAEFLQAISQAKGRIILVSNEVGQGIVPLGEVSRRFVDESGWLHQAIAKQSARVIFVTAGIPQVLKGPTLSFV